MKKKLLFAGCLMSVASIAQTTIDTVSLGAGYTNQSWYSLENDEQVNVSKSDWDIAFEISGFGTSGVMINHATGTEVWSYQGDTSEWSTLDTIGMSSWTQQYNSDTSWSYGALSQNQNGLDLGWGTYSVITHTVVGDELFVIKLSDGSYQKLWITGLASGTYTFRHATLDNSMDMTHSIVKANYTGKNNAYYSLTSHQAIDKEPLASDWDLMFGQYGAEDQGFYNVSGVLSNKATKVAEAYPVNAVTYSNYNSHNFNTEINTIGYDWKTYDFTQGWIIEDSLVYFVETQYGDIWKLVFTDFSGSSAGNFIFSKEKMGVNALADDEINLLNFYPNPVSDIVNISLKTNAATQVDIVDMNGKVVMTKQLTSGLQTTTINVGHLQRGMYLLSISTSNEKQCKRIIIE